MCLSIQSCEDAAGVRYSEQIIVDPAGWSQDKTIVFDDVQIADENELHIRITHETNYKYDNLYLKVKVLQDTSISFDNFFSIPLTNGQGQWEGAPNGSDRVVDYFFDKELPLDKPLNIEVSQYSREHILKGIEQVELLITTQNRSK